MAVGNWHVGKIVLLWIMCEVPAWVWLLPAGGQLVEGETWPWAVGLWLLALPLVVAPFAVTWRWLGAREKRPKAASRESTSDDE